MEWLGNATVRGHVTISQGSPVNNAPSTPTAPDSPANMFVNQLYTFSTTSADPEAQRLHYMWDFGDSMTDWTGSFDSDSIADIDHVWDQSGDFIIRVKSKDIFGLESEWSDPVDMSLILCGDADGSAAVDIDDVVFLINYIFGGGPAPDPIASGDADSSGEIDIDDVVYLIQYIFAGGPAPCE